MTAKKRDKEREARREHFRELLEQAKADLIASGNSVLTPEEWELPSSERGRLVLERNEAERKSRRARDARH